MVDHYARESWGEICDDGSMVEEVGLEVMLGDEVDTATRRSGWDEKTGLATGDLKAWSKCLMV